MDNASKIKAHVAAALSNITKQVGPSIEQMADLGERGILLGHMGCRIENGRITAVSVLPGPPPEWGARRNTPPAPAAPVTV